MGVKLLIELLERCVTVALSIVLLIWVFLEIEQAVFLCAHLLTYADLSTAPQPPARARPKVSPRVKVVPKKRSPAQVRCADVRISS